jgi:hypothetical protein
MQKTSQFIRIYLYIINVVENYSLNLNLIVKMLSTFLLFHFNSGLIILKNIRWGQSAWLQINNMSSNHQRLNIEQSKNMNLMYNHSKSINRSKFYNNKEEFYH